MNSKQNTAQQTRRELLNAAYRVVKELGATALTLDAVAKQAHISKGGLLHHFPTKNALIEGLLRDLLDTFSARVEALYALEPDGRGRWLRAYVRASFEDEAHIVDIRAILGVFAESDTALQMLHEDNDRWLQRFTPEGVTAARIKIIQRAADAQWIEAVLGASNDDRDAIMAELFSLIDSDRGQS